MCGCRNGAGNRGMVVNNNRSVAANNNRLRSKDIELMEQLQTISQGDDFVDVIYNGPKYPHYIPTLTDYIRKVYGITNYGYGKKGVQLRVHNFDVLKAESTAGKSGALPLFQRIEKPKEEIQLVNEIENIETSEEVVELENIEEVVEQVSEVEIIEELAGIESLEPVNEVETVEENTETETTEEVVQEVVKRTRKKKSE